MGKHDAGAGRHILMIPLAVILSGILVTTGVFSTAGITGGRASGDNAGNVSYAEDTAGKTQEAIEGSFPGLSGSSGAVSSLTKDETVYVIMDADGNEQERVVNEWLRNPEELDEISDRSNLRNIRNTGGEETFEQDGKKLVWAAGGKDIKYSGTNEKDLPVSVDVTYYLNGEAVSASDIAGRSGDVEIRFDYGVNARDRIVNGSSGYELTHPYIMASGVLLDTELFSGIEVTNGRVINEAGQAICLGIALPGLGDDLALPGDAVDIPESVVIRAKTSGFRLGGTYTAALSGVLGDMDLSTDGVTDRLGELESALSMISKASGDLVKGSRKVASGAGELSTGADELSDGTDELSDGTSALKKGGDELSKGVSRLKSGAGQLSDGTGKIKSGVKEADDGAKKLKSGLDEINSHSEELNDATDRLEENVFDNATELLQSRLIAAGMPEEEAKLFTLSPSTYKVVFDLLKKQAPEHEEEFQAAEDRLDAMEEYVEGIKSYTAAVDEAAGGAEDLSEGIGTLADGADDVDDGADKVYEGLKALSGKIPALKKGISRLASGAGKVDSGADELSSGADRLSSGADDLADGMAKFDKEGIKKLVNSLDSASITETLDRINAVTEAAGRRHFVGGTPGKIAGESRIIFRTGAVE